MMNEQQRWVYIEQLFNEMAKECEEILRLLGDNEHQRQVGLFMESKWVPNKHLAVDLSPTNISDEEALEAAKEYLRTGGK